LLELAETEERVSQEQDLMGAVNTIEGDKDAYLMSFYWS
jgi:hypothetical protein